MKLLITTQKVDKNDDVLGFFHSWIAEFAKHCQKLTVICLQKGEYDLPSNVKVLSLGKEKYINSPNFSFVTFSPRGCWGAFIRRFALLLKFYQYIWRERKNYEAIFVHMNPEYVVLGGLFWKLWQKKIALWYVHKAVPWQLRVAEKFTNIIFTASSESCNLKSKKIKIVGHGIDINKFKLRTPKERNEFFNIIYVGRISPIKNQKLLIQAVSELVNKENIKNIKVELIGGTVYAQDEKYKQELKDLIDKYKLNNCVHFRGRLPFSQMPKIYAKADLSLNLCPTGGIDKAVLESMAAGVPPIVLNQSFSRILSPYKDLLLLSQSDKKELAAKIKTIINLSSDQYYQLAKQLNQIIKRQYSLGNLILKIIAEIKI